MHAWRRNRRVKRNEGIVPLPKAIGGTGEDVPEADVQGDTAVGGGGFPTLYATCTRFGVSGVYRRRFCAYGSYGSESEPRAGVAFCLEEGIKIVRCSKSIIGCFCSSEPGSALGAFLWTLSALIVFIATAREEEEEEEEKWPLHYWWWGFLKILS